jgi:WD40 repeat protein/serine/threonine protein kinase
MNASDQNPAPGDTTLPPEPEQFGPLDPRFAELLAAYDELLALGAAYVVGQIPAVHGDVELMSEKACLHLLERVFPRANNQERPHHQTLGQFEILCELGRGGGGIVFLAIDTELGRQVALKVPYPDVLVWPNLRQRFVEEAQAAAKLRHPNIIPVFEAGEVGLICYIASEYCPGPTLGAWLQARGSPVPFRLAAELVVALSDAIEHAHSQGILHRDIKPRNVLLELGVGCQVSVPDDETQESPVSVVSVSSVVNKVDSHSDQDGPARLVPKLTDFGLAKLMERERDATRTGAVLGTPNYMAPEQAEGRLADIGVATDVYGLGVVLYELIAGRPPFQGESDFHTLQQIARDDPPPPGRFRSRATSSSWIRQNSGALLKFGNFSYGSQTVPRDLEAICLRCLEKSPARRYQRAADLAADLRRFLEGLPTVARPIGWPTRAAKWTRRRPALAGIVAMLLISTAAALFGLLWHNSRITHLESTADARIQLQAAEQHERQRQYDYADYIHGAYQAWQATDLQSAMELLDRCRPGPGEEDLRGWEWYYVRRLCAGGILTLRGHDGPVLGAAFAPDGEQLASCGADGTLRIWEVASGKITTTIPAHKGLANAVAWSPDGTMLATVGDDAHVRIWDAEINTLRAVFAGASDEALFQNRPRERYIAIPRRQSGTEGDGAEIGAKLLSVAFSPDSQQVAAAGEEGVIRVWDVATGEVTSTFRGHTDTIYSLAFSPNGYEIASGSADLTARIWDLRAPTDHVAVLYPDPRTPVTSVVFSPDGRTLATADSQISLWDLAARTPIARMNAHRNHIHSVAFSLDGEVVASASSDTTVRTWDAISPFTSQDIDIPQTEKRLLNTYRGHVDAVLHVMFSPQGSRLASAGKDGTIQVWDATCSQDRMPVRPPSPASNVIRVAFSHAGTTLAIASQDDNQVNLEICRGLVHDPVFTVAASRIISDLTSLAFSLDGNYLGISGVGNPLLVYDIVRAQVRSLNVPGNILACDSSPDGKRLAIASHDWNSTRIVDIATGKMLASVPGQRAVAFSPDDRLLATESSDVGEFYPVELWDVSAGKSAGRLIGHKGEINSIVFSADGQLLATGSADGTARVWRLEDLTEQQVLRADRDGVHRVAFLLGAKSLATATYNGAVNVWHVATGRHLLTLDTAHSPLTGMAVSADGRTLAIVGGEAHRSARVDLWTAPLEADEQ